MSCVRNRMTALAGSTALAVSVLAATPSRPVQETAAPASPREFFNAGTQKLREGKLREAEAFFESALAGQNERLQPPALYNLGHVRFNQGVEELKKGPAGGAAADRGRGAARTGDESIRSADEALAGNDLEQMVAAYLRGRGSRREIRAAMTAVKKAMDAHKATLNKWQRASGDFRGTVELKRPDPDAQHNAEVVDQCIAKLVDSLRELEQMANALGNKKQELGDKLKQLKGRIPAPNMPPGAAGDDEEDEDEPKGPQPGQKEGPSKEGKEMTLSQEQAGWLLDSFKLDSERRLPMGQGPEAQPKDRNRPDW
jgi:tetratricopeptide (TPR) repeat protein